MTDGLVLCGVDTTDADTTVMTAAKAAGGSLLLVHVSNGLWGREIPAFAADTGSERLVDHGPVGPRLLTIAKARGAGISCSGRAGSAGRASRATSHSAPPVR